MLTRKVTIEVTCRIEREYPADWSDDLIEFHCNESSSCADNLLADRLRQKDCSCWVTTARVLKEDEC